MADEHNLSIDDIKSVGDKLESMGGDLSDGEREVLGWILARAEASWEDDVAGFAFQRFEAKPQIGQLSKFQTQVGRGVGLRGPDVLAAGNITVSGSWSW